MFSLWGWAASLCQEWIATIAPNAGASPGGIGCATAKQLAAKGFHTVLACRDMEKGQTAKQEIM